jgi:hypothetical protein
MPILPNPSVSPLHSFAPRPYATHPVTFVASLKAIIVWWRGESPSLRQSIREREIVEQLADDKLLLVLDQVEFVILAIRRS